MPDTKQQYGLPFQGLPGTQRDLTPESVINEQTQTGRRKIQQQFNLAWNEINNSARFVGQAKAERMRSELHAKAKQEMLQFNQQAKQQMVQLQNINRLAEQGLITNPDEIKARMTFGTDVAKSMYPGEASIPEQFGKLDVYSHRISDELGRFQIVGGKTPSKFLSRLKYVSPLATAISALRGPPKGRRGELKIWDPNIATKIKDKTTGKMVDAMGVWRKAEPEEITEYKMWVAAEKDIARQKTELAGRSDITRRTAQPGAGSGFDAGVAGSVTPQRTPATTKPKIIKQRNTRTGQVRISYDGGKTWQTSG